jgi:multiple sugar transport system substrate-binding protein
VITNPTNQGTTQPLQRDLTRRDFLKTTGVVGVAAATSSSLGLFGGQAPAFAQSRTVHVLAWSHFIKEADALMRDKLIPEFKASSGVNVKYETINANDLNARITAAVESGTGPDIFQMIWNQPHLYTRGLENHDSLAAELGVNKQYAFQQEAAKVDGVFRGVPYYGIGNGIAYRKDIFEEAGVTKVPDTLDEYLEAGKKLKDHGWPVGQTLGHTFGDAPTFCYPLLWSFGGREVDENGKVAINSPETLRACEFLQEFWNAACDESGLAWDDSSNNRAFFAETIGATLNGASIYFVARYNPEKAPPGLADKIGHFLNPQGPAGRYHSILPFTHGIAQYSKQKDAAKDFIRFLMGKKAYETYILVQKGYGLGATPDWENHPFWKEDPAVEPYRLNAKYGRNFGWPGPYDRKAAEVQAKYIIIDLFARVARGDSPKASIAQTERELKNVYESA